LPLHVFDQRHLEALVFGAGANDRRDVGETGALRGAPAALSAMISKFPSSAGDTKIG